MDFNRGLLGNYLGWIFGAFVGLIAVLFLLCVMVILCVHVVDILVYNGCYFDAVFWCFNVEMAK